MLVIDDEEDTRELLTIALTQSGAEVRTAATVRAALNILDQWKSNVLVSDIGMLGEDGYDLIRTVRALESERGSPGAYRLRQCRRCSTCPRGRLRDLHAEAGST